MIDEVVGAQISQVEQKLSLLASPSPHTTNAFSGLGRVLGTGATVSSNEKAPLDNTTAVATSSSDNKQLVIALLIFSVVYWWWNKGPHGDYEALFD
jgi:hypothetical protein